MEWCLTQDECQNYIRVIARRLDGLYLVCATNAYRPLCRTYTTDEARDHCSFLVMFTDVWVMLMVYAV